MDKFKLWFKALLKDIVELLHILLLIGLLFVIAYAGYVVWSIFK